MSNIAKIFLGSNEVCGENLVEIRNPYSKEVVSFMPKCDETIAKRALDIANSAKKNAKNSPLHKRISWLNDVANKLELARDEFAQTITNEVAKPISQSLQEVNRAIETIRVTILSATSLNGEQFFSDIMPSGKESISYFKREPVGVVVAITPFNFPLNLVVHKLAPALLAGNCVVLKPTPEAPLCAYKLAKLFVESEFASKDALSLVYGDADVGNALVTSEIPRVISFTGSLGVAKIISKNSGIKKLSFELGGNAATYIEKSANLKYAASRCALGAFVNSGQVCISLQRIYVESRIYNEFATLLKDEVQKLIVGTPFEKETFMSSLINEDANNRALEWIESAKREGAKVLCGGKIEDGIFLPTIMIDVKDEMEIICQEVFAPIVSLIEVKDFDEAVLKMNNSPFGLQFSIFTNDLGLSKMAIEEFECGGIVVNDIPTLRFDIQPYGGVKYSGIGREGPKFAIEEFTEIKSVVIL